MAIDIDILLSRIGELCKKRNITLNAAFVESGVGKNFKSNLKTANPSMGKITMLANYFGVTSDYLIGESERPHYQNGVVNVTPLSEKESKLIFAYRTQPDMQAAVDKLLGVVDVDDVTLYAAARSYSSNKPVVDSLPPRIWSKLEETPDTDDKLL